MSAGRSGEQAAQGLTQNLHEIGIKTERLKTGTPARVDKRSIIFDELDIQPSTAANKYFSFDPDIKNNMPQVSCHITRTTAKTHQLIRENLHLTPIYGGLLIVRVQDIVHQLKIKSLNLLIKNHIKFS